jgi:hypothetical protein
MRGKNLRLPVEKVLARARELVGTGKYSLVPGKNGGSDPEAKSPYDMEDGTADCVGVGMFIQGADRYQPQIMHWGGWVNTNSVFGMPELFRNMGQDFNVVREGDILAYPSYKDWLGRIRYGHWMTVTGLPGGLVRATKLSDILVTHCSQKRYPATTETPGFAKGRAKDWAFFRPVWR